MLRKSPLFMLALLTATATACAHKQAMAPPAPPPPAPAPVVAAAPPAPAASAAVACASDQACAPDQLCVGGACTAITPSLSACGLTRVHFDFDADQIHPSAYPALQRMARCLQANQPAHVLITGNADERGTVAYNLALGQRRAAAVRKYLVDLGVQRAPLALVSYGKELPLCEEHDEACWAQNRRSGIRPDEAAKDVKAKVQADERREEAAPKK